MANDLYVFIGLALGFGAEFWIGMANIQIKYSHKLDSKSSKPRPAYKRCRWWLGFSLLVVNSVFNFFSYMFASLNILAPTSALVIVINAALAWYYFKEKLTFFGILGSISIMIGCVFSIVFGVHSQDELTSDSLWINAKSMKFILWTSIHGFLSILFGIIGSCFCHETKKEFDENATNKAFASNNVEMIVNPTTEYIATNDEVNKSGAICTTTAGINNDIVTDNLLILTMNTINNDSNKEWKHIVRCLLLSFSASGCVGWVQFLGKLTADFMFETLFYGNNQFDSAAPFIIVIVLCVLLSFQLFLISEVMRIFDAVLIVPIYNSFQILSCLAISAVYFNNFETFTIVDSFMFPLGLILIFIGIGLVSHGQKHASMEHHESDHKNYRKNLQTL